MGAKVALLLAASVAGPPPPSNQTLILYNARVALREGKPSEALKLWLLRNVMAKVEGHVGQHDAQLRSNTWAALGSLGMCGDGFSKDEGGGAGLWPLAVHNQVVATLVRGAVPSPQNPVDAFDVGRQQRFISLNDVLDPAELKSATFFRTACVLPDSTMLSLGKTLTVQEGDRLGTAPVLKQLLTLALETLDRAKVESVAVVEARIFDVDLAMIQMAERKKRREAMQAKAEAKRAGLTETAVAEKAEETRKWPPGSPQAELLKKTLTWRPDEWMTLNASRRLFLYAQAKPLAPSPETTRALALGIIDRLAARGAGEELEAWLGNLELEASIAGRAAVTEGARGKQLLALEPSTGFRERAVIALHRGVGALEAGQQLEALRAFGFAMAHADESREASAVLSLSRRWLSYVLSRYQTDAEVLATLRALVPRQEYNTVIEELIWRAALRADRASFEMLAATVQHGGSIDARVAKLEPLARGDVGALATRLRDAAVDEPHLTLRFARLLLEKIEAEDADVRVANIPMLKALSKVLDGIATSAGPSKSQARTAEELLGRVQGILEGLAQLDASAQARARALSVRHETFAGNIRLAPADALPWPFAAPRVSAASVFVPLKLEPLEWRDAGGQLVFGWRISE